MKGVFLHSGSPYYWFRYYDVFEQDPKKKRKEHNTKIPVISSDLRKWKERKPKEPIKLQGTPELWRKVKELKIALADRKFEKNTNSSITKKLLLSEGFKEFKTVKTVPGMKGQLKLKTLSNYSFAVDHMISACGDKYIYKYTAEKDYVKLLHYFENKKSSINTRSIYTRALRSLWKYFVDKSYTRNNIILPVESEEKDPDPILLSDMVVIIEYFKFDKRFQHHYWLIYFMLLTGCRPSSAIMQTKENIDFKKKRITIHNIKTGKTKKKLFYGFPLYSELEKLIKEMGVKEGDTGRLFDMFAVIPENYTWPLTFWKRSISFLKKANKISKEYNLKQIRPTFISFLINALKMDIYTVYKLADHADIKVTDKNYIDFRLNSARKILDDVTLSSFLDED